MAEDRQNANGAVAAPETMRRLFPGVHRLCGKEEGRNNDANAGLARDLSAGLRLREPKNVATPMNALYGPALWIWLTYSFRHFGWSA